MKTVYLIRHGRPDFPGNRRMCLGRTDLPLCARGFEEAAEAARTLQGQELQVFCSPLLRAVQTAEALGRPLTVLEGLQELYAGEWDGLDFDTIRALYPQLYAARTSDKTIPLPGAESNEAGLRRFRAAVTLAAEQADGDLAVVAHGGVMALFLQAVTGTWEKPAYGQIVTLTYENGIFKRAEEP